MNKQRLEIKRLFDEQEKVIWNKSRNRRRIYYEQLDRFKYFYVAWKHFTYYIYLERCFNVSRHHCTSLSFFKHNNIDVNGIRYQL